MKRLEQIKEAAKDRYTLTDFAFIAGAEWADNNPQDQNQLIIDLIHQRSVAFDYGREQSEMLKIAMEALINGSKDGVFWRENALEKIKGVENGK
jgi:hypothetical protein